MNKDYTKLEPEAHSIFCPPLCRFVVRLRKLCEVMLLFKVGTYIRDQDFRSSRSIKKTLALAVRFAVVQSLNAIVTVLM